MTNNVYLQTDDASLFIRVDIFLIEMMADIMKKCCINYAIKRLRAAGNANLPTP